MTAYKHYFCDECAKQWQDTIISDAELGIQTTWEPFTDETFSCNWWSDDESGSETLHKRQSCANPVTKVLKATGGNPIKYANS